MESKKQKLIRGLNLVINALKNNTIHYEWTEQHSCNCGVVAQSILGRNKVEINQYWVEASGKLGQFETDKKKIDRTWQNAVKHLCPITGEPMAEIFKKLFEAGLSKSDIVHLEYMDNKAILDRSGINMKIRKTIKEKVFEKTVEETEIQKHPNFFLRLFGKKIEVKVKKDVFKEVSSEKTVDDDNYHTRRGNLIKYLTAWVLILQEGIKYTESELSDLNASQLENELLVAVAEENYEYATVLRDKLNFK